jgi:DNA-binding HxlR family transcriptional regulator
MNPNMFNPPLPCAWFGLADRYFEIRSNSLVAAKDVVARLHGLGGQLKYGQFCPVAKAAEVIGERWMLLVLRELMAGATSYTELQRGLGRISPSVLASRISALTEHGIIERVAASSAKGHRYRLTPAGTELAPVIDSIGRWGQRWVRSRMTRDELDVELLMLHIERSFDASAFPKNHAVVAFVFSDLRGSLRSWWLLLDDGQTELCAQSPGRAEDLRLTCGLRTMTEVFSGDTTVKTALAAGRLEAEGPLKLLRNVERWLCPSAFARVPRAG